MSHVIPFSPMVIGIEKEVLFGACFVAMSVLKLSKVVAALRIVSDCFPVPSSSSSAESEKMYCSIWR